MNYFAHGHLHIDRPWFLVGTALPDLLSAADRRVRLRSKRVEPFAHESEMARAELAAGVLQHLADDQWFHGTRAFFETSGRLAQMFRDMLGPDDGFRPGFLGHITTEILLDAALIERHPERLDTYYQSLAAVDAQIVQDAVNRMAKTPTDQITAFLPLFCDVQFLRDYIDPVKLLFRLNQVMRRVKLKPLPDETIDLLERARGIVAGSADDLMTPGD